MEPSTPVELPPEIWRNILRWYMFLRDATRPLPDAVMDRRCERLDLRDPNAGGASELQHLRYVCACGHRSLLSTQHSVANQHSRSTRCICVSQRSVADETTHRNTARDVRSCADTDGRVLSFDRSELLPRPRCRTAGTERPTSSPRHPRWGRCPLRQAVI